MQTWRMKLDLRDLWKRYQAEPREITIPELGKEFAKRMRKLDWSIRDCAKINRLANALEMATEESEINEALEEVYDVGDTNKQCWVATF